MESFVVIGAGQLGRLFAGGALAKGRRVLPILRGDGVASVLADVAMATPILIATGEGAMAGVVHALPSDRRDDVILVQNELFPHVWEDAGCRAPTVAVVWLSCKFGRPIEIARPTAVFGRHAAFLAEVHHALKIGVTVLDSASTLLVDLVAKYAFILAINTLGLEKDLTLGDWVREDEDRVDAVIADAIGLAIALGQGGDPAAAALVKEAMLALDNYPAKGRTAAARLQRARADAARLQVPLPAIGRA